MNASSSGVTSALTSADASTRNGTWSVSPETIYQILLAIVGVNAVGVVGNVLLVIGLLLLRGSGRMSRASVQMLIQQASVDFLTCLTAIGYV